MAQRYRKKTKIKDDKVVVRSSVALKRLAACDSTPHYKLDGFNQYFTEISRLADNIAPLGTITFLRKEIVKNKIVKNTSILIDGNFDKKFLSRPDYKLWYIFSIIKDVKKFDPDEIQKLFEEGLKHENATIIWGVLVCLNLREYQERALNQYRVLDLLEIAEKRQDDLPPISGLEAECFLTSIRIKSYHQQLAYNTLGKRQSSTVITKLFSSLCHDLQRINPEWEPGTDFSLESFKIARNKGLYLIPSSYHIFSTVMAYSLYHSCQALIYSLEQISKETQELLNIAANLMRTVWLLQRSHRKGAENSPNPPPRKKLDSMRFDEYNALFSYCQALRSAGKYHLSNIHAWYLLATLPPELEKNGDFQYIPTNIAGNVRQAGLTVDIERYPLSQKDMIDGEQNSTWGILPSSPLSILDEDVKHLVPNHHQQQTTCDRRTTSWISPSTKDQTFDLCIQYDIEHNEETKTDWQIILEMAGNKNDPWSTLREWLKTPLKTVKSAPTNFLISLLHLAFHYGQIKSAARVLSHMPSPPVELILELANIIQKQCIILPLAIDKSTLVLWIAAIHNGVNRVAFNDDEYAVIHGVLKTQLVHTRTISPVRLVERLFDLRLTEERNLRPPGANTEISTQNTSTDNNVISRENKAVYVSLMNLGKTVSILATADKQRFKEESLHTSSHSKEICQSWEWNLCTDCDHESGRKRLRGKQHVIPGDEALDHLKSIADKIFELAEKILSENPEVIYFSPGADLVNLPWQYLFYVVATTQRKTHWPIISIVPSLDWMQAAISQTLPKRCLKRCMSESSDLKEYVEMLEKRVPPLPTRKQKS